MFGRSASGIFVEPSSLPECLSSESHTTGEAGAAPRSMALGHSAPATWCKQATIHCVQSSKVNRSMRRWEARGRTILDDADRVPKVMGIVNVTPDSFSDGGLTLEPAAALRMLAPWPRRGPACSIWEENQRVRGPTP